MFRFLPWKMIVRRAARAYGIADPALWLARIRQFSQPSEVQEPIELLRAGIHFHARGLINTKAIQHNLDWVWPYWVERQFDPADDSFLPRAFSFSHINLTHRNWTAVGLPELSLYPIVDPRGLVTPLHDGWSIDFWLSDGNGKRLIPGRTLDEDADQTLTAGGELAVQTTLWESDLHLRQRTEVVIDTGQPVLKISVNAASSGGGTLAMAIRPYNPEGVQFIDRVESLPGHTGWMVNETTQVRTDRAANRLLSSHYDDGDLVDRIDPDRIDRHPSSRTSRQAIGDLAVEVCDQGMATAASVFDFSEDEMQLVVLVPLEGELKMQGHPKTFRPETSWADVLADAAALSVPDPRIQRLYEAAVKTLVLLSVDEIVPGPYTYRRFWFRDACLMMNALMNIGFTDRCRRMLNEFPARQLRNGYFRSQEGEWDSNGQVLWVLNRYRRLTHSLLPSDLMGMLDRAVSWIDQKRVDGHADCRHAGLLPAGFSAEHLGPNDFYYWDDFWAEAGLRAAAEIWRDAGQDHKAAKASRIANELHEAIEQSLPERSRPEPGLREPGLPEPGLREHGRRAAQDSSGLPSTSADSRKQRDGHRGIPASPYRRMDAGAVGSLVADYPLQLTPANDPMILATVDALIAKHFYRGGFMQDMIHSGINTYLTLAIAQTLLRNGDPRWRTLVDAVADLASPTGQWPEAIHPRTLGGCMGDGQHGWAAAEWVMMLRNCFVREEADRLVIGSGLFREWFQQDHDIAFGPTLTPWGRVSVRIVQPQTHPMLVVDGHWHRDAPEIDIHVPGFAQITSASDGQSLELRRLASEEFRVEESIISHQQT
ncbi:MAG: hypothetical protein R3C59_15015 [Planctomycetaceae bacterium]